MNHWIDPTARGVYDHPGAPPPNPQRRDSNDISARLARVEEHTAFAAWDRQRAERESRMRAADLTAGLSGLHARMLPLEQHLDRRRYRAKLIRKSMVFLLYFGRSIAVLVAVVMMLKGLLPVDKFKALMGVLIPGL